MWVARGKISKKASGTIPFQGGRCLQEIPYTMVSNWYLGQIWFLPHQIELYSHSGHDTRVGLHYYSNPRLQQYILQLSNA